MSSRQKSSKNMKIGLKSGNEIVAILSILKYASHAWHKLVLVGKTASNIAGNIQSFLYFHNLLEIRNFP